MTILDAVRARFACNGGLPFADVLTEASILGVFSEHGVEYRDRVFDPVTRIIAYWAASGLGTYSPYTASYCNARGRLHAAVLREAAP